MYFYPQRWLVSLLQWRKFFDKTQERSEYQLVEAGVSLPVRCRQCRTVITQATSAIEMAGSHQHALTNPAGIRFIVLVYRHANCELTGTPTEEYSWFSGYAWQMALCLQCNTHLGWYYSHGQFPDFYGLIAPRLLLESP